LRWFVKIWFGYNDHSSHHKNKQQSDVPQTMDNPTTTIITSNERPAPTAADKATFFVAGEATLFVTAGEATGRRVAVDAAAEGDRVVSPSEYWHRW
jgi:hypothetical protein